MRPLRERLRRAAALVARLCGRPAAPTRCSADEPPATVTELCLAWHQSYRLLHGLPADTVTAGQRAEIVALRQELLDELERRDPDGFGRWLEGEPAPTDDPARFLRP